MDVNFANDKKTLSLGSERHILLIKAPKLVENSLKEFESFLWVER